MQNNNETEEFERYEIIRLPGGHFTYKDVVTGRQGTVTFDSQPTYYSKYGLILGTTSSSIGTQRNFYVNPEDDHVFVANAFDYPQVDRIPYGFEKMPEDFEHLPTECFRDKRFIQRCLNSISVALKDPKYKDAKKAQELYATVCGKVKKEEIAIARKDDREARRTPANEHFAAAVKELGKNFARITVKNTREI